MKRRRTLVTAAVFAPALAVLALLAYLTLFDRGTLRLADLRGKVVFLNFWASWMTTEDP